jgi:hypothetical protein
MAIVPLGAIFLALIAFTYLGAPRIAKVAQVDIHRR